MLKEFKEFAFKGNLVDMAVGFILGGAFATVVKTFVAKVVMPPLGLLLGDVDFADMKYVLKAGAPEVKEGDKVVTPAVEEVVIAYGEFLNDFIAFVMLALVVFIVVKKFIAAFEKKEAAAPAAPPKQEVLLEEIRDALKK
ncbi:MAG: large-conductance mechanosensitive channel protein MscL [Akkermansiaceae bacterium]|nr:large-conductance mechanosensitive channel protein MscL [Akkermansiaceae bacterium]